MTESVLPTTGIHLLGNLLDCDQQQLAHYRQSELQQLISDLLRETALQELGSYYYQFGGGGGVTGVSVLAESHIAIHTWPELNYVTLDIYVCNYQACNTPKVGYIFDRLVQAFRPKNVVRNEVIR